MASTMNVFNAVELTDYIAKRLRKADAKQLGWPGVPLAQFGCIGTEAEALRALLADGTVILIERPKADPSYTATFVCLPSRKPATDKNERIVAN